tara:strand:+ start:173 stop:706 length:534 start_codon:yes stop_codon:yes gene_type:complete
MSKNAKFITIILIFVMTFFVLLKGLNKENNYSPNLNSNKIDFDFKSKFLYSNDEITLKELIKNNDFSIINIWASWCLPCRDEHYYLLELKSLNILNIIGINYKDNELNAKKFIKELGNPYSSIVVDPSGINSIELGAYGVPETFLIDNKSKNIIRKYIGPLDEKKFLEIKKIIKNEK